MAYTANQIKNLALQEINHEMIADSDWSDTSNTDIPIINTQYTLAKSVALSMYQWSWAFKYAVLNTYKYSFDMPADRESGLDVYTMPTASIAQTVGDSLSEIAVNAVTFTSQIGVDGEYAFMFDGADWLYDGNAVDLNDYGITFTGTPVIGDGLTVAYVAPKDAPNTADNSKIYVNEEQIYFGYIATGNIQTYVVLDGTPISDIVSSYKRATLLPTDFIGYLAAYTDDKMHVLADYLNVGTTLYTNSEKLYIKYIASVDEAVFTPEFVDWFKMFLAQRLNGYLNGDMQRQALLTQEEPFFFRKAKNIDSKRNKHESLDGNPMLWIRGRIGGGM